MLFWKQLPANGVMFTPQRGLSLYSSSYVFWWKAAFSKAAMPGSPHQGGISRLDKHSPPYWDGGFQRADALSPLFAIETSPIFASKTFPVVRHRTSVYSRAWSFPSFCFLSIHWTACTNSEFNKANRHFLRQEMPPKNLRPFFCWISSLIAYAFRWDKR